jgi:2,4-dienoyl-CoA reductase-like NADH-dependent reductase (Old Yellow Enzyme family)
MAEETSKPSAEEIRRRFIEVLEQRGLRMYDPNEPLTEAEINSTIERYMTAADKAE